MIFGLFAFILCWVNLALLVVNNNNNQNIPSTTLIPTTTPAPSGEIVIETGVCRFRNGGYTMGYLAYEYSEIFLNNYVKTYAIKLSPNNSQSTFVFGPGPFYAYTFASYCPNSGPGFFSGFEIDRCTKNINGTENLNSLVQRYNSYATPQIIFEPNLIFNTSVLYHAVAGDYVPGDQIFCFNNTATVNYPLNINFVLATNVDISSTSFNFSSPVKFILPINNPI